MSPATQQPFVPPVPAVAVWAIPREGASELASMLYAYITWGHEPHHSQVSDAEFRRFESERERWEAGTLKLLEMLERVGHIAFVPHVPTTAPTEK